MAWRPRVSGSHPDRTRCRSCSMEAATPYRLLRGRSTSRSCRRAVHSQPGRTYGRIERGGGVNIADGPTGLLVKLDVFDGPMDLLLQLVLAQDLDITQVSLASVCEQYLAYINLMESLDIELASEYLVIAATLTFIKSKRLLPPPPPPFVDELAEEADSAEEALRQRLIAYQFFKLAGSDLRTRFDDNRAFYARSVPCVDDIVQRYRLQ